MLLLRRFEYFTKRSYPIVNQFKFYSDYASANENRSIQNVKLIDALNKLDKWEIKYKDIISATQFLKLQQWKQDNGNIQQIDDLHRIDGFDVDSIEKLQLLCDPALISIEDDNYYEMQSYINLNQSTTLPTYDDDDNKTNQNEIISDGSWYLNMIKKNSRTLKLSLEPKQSKIHSNKIQTFTAIHFESECIGWTTFKRLNDLPWNKGAQIEWECSNVQTVDNDVCSKVTQLSQLINKIPNSNVYIMESNSKWKKLRKSMTSKVVSEIVQINQINTIVTTLLMQRFVNEQNDKVASNVYLLGPLLVGRLYGLFVGRETVSAETTVRNIFKNQSTSNNSFIIDVNDNAKNIFNQSKFLNRECLGRSMLVGLTFLHLAL